MYFAQLALSTDCKFTNMDKTRESIIYNLAVITENITRTGVEGSGLGIDLFVGVRIEVVL